MNGLPRLWCGLVALLLAAEGAAQPAKFGDVTDPDNAPLPKGALVRLGSSRLRAGEFLKLAFFPGGKTVVMCGTASGLGLWDVDSGHQYRCYSRWANPQFALSRDGKLVMGGTNIITIWETMTGKELHRFEGSVSVFAFSPDGTVLAVGGNHDPAVRLLDLATFKEVGRLEGQKKETYQLAFSADGKWLASYDSDSSLIHLWDVAARQQRSSVKVWFCRSLTFVGGNRLVTASADGKLRVWDVPSGKLQRVLIEQKEETWHVVASTDGGMLTATLADGVHVWDTATWKELRRWECGRFVHALAFAPDGKSLAMAHSGDGVPRFWDMASGKELRPTKGHRGPVAALAFSADGKTLSSLSSDHTARAWDWLGGGETKCLSLGPNYANHLALAPDRKTAVVAWHNERQFHLWDIAAGKSLGSLAAPGGSMRTQLVSPDSRLVAWQSWDRKVHVQPIAGGKEIHQWSSDDSAGMAFSPDGTTFVFGEPSERPSIIHVKDLMTGNERHSIEIPGRIAGISASPNGRCWATTTFNGSASELRLWDADGWKLLYSAGKHDGCPVPLFSPDSRLLALPNVHRNSFRVLEVATGKEVRKFDGLRAHAGAAAFSPDGRVLAVADGNSTILVWDLTGQLREGKLTEIELSPTALAARWNDLAGADAARAFDAVWAMVASPRQSLVLLVKQMQPATVPAEIPGLIRDLDSEEFETRDRAWRALFKLGEAADPALRAANKNKLPLEVKRRIERLLDQPRLPLPPGDRIRGVRAVQVLEFIGNAEAQRLLQTLADGADLARLTQDARAALGRIVRRATVN